MYLQPKVKSQGEFSLDTIHSRMAIIGYELYEINLPPHITAFEVKRKFLANIYGGSMVASFPTISKENFDRHGMDDFLYLTCKYNPWAPQVSGAPGLLFECCYLLEFEDERGRIRRLFVRTHDGWWLYIGQIRIECAPSLTAQEWMSQSPSVNILPPYLCAYINISLRFDVHGGWEFFIKHGDSLYAPALRSANSFIGNPQQLRCPTRSNRVINLTN